MADPQVTRVFEWDAAHRVLHHGGKCASLHGHRYRAEVTVARALDAQQMVVDFGDLKRLVGGWIDTHWDHTTLVNREDEGLLRFCMDEAQYGKKQPYVFRGEPTAEAIAMELGRVARSLVPGVIQVVVYETPNCWATSA